MGFGGISIWQLLIILAIVVLIFGTKRFKNIGADLGSAIKGFKQSVNEEPKVEDKDPSQEQLSKDADFSAEKKKESEK